MSSRSAISSNVADMVAFAMGMAAARILQWKETLEPTYHGLTSIG
jgi:hypothetical protein